MDNEGGACSRVMMDVDAEDEDDDDEDDRVAGALPAAEVENEAVGRRRDAPDEDARSPSAPLRHPPLPPPIPLPAPPLLPRLSPRLGANEAVSLGTGRPWARAWSRSSAVVRREGGKGGTGVGLNRNDANDATDAEEDEDEDEEDEEGGPVAEATPLPLPVDAPHPAVVPR